MMAEDLPMFDAYNADDAEMLDDDTYDYEMQEEPAAGMQEYDMDGGEHAEYEDVIPAEPIVPTPEVDVPILEEAETVIVEEEREPAQALSSQPAFSQILPPVTPAEFVPLPQLIPTSGDPSHPAIVPEILSLEPSATTNTPLVESAALSAPTPVINIPALPDDVPVPPAVQSEAPYGSSATIESPAIPHEDSINNIPIAQQPVISEESNTTFVPPIAFYFEQQVFSLFAPFQSSEGESCLPVLLSGRHGLYTSPLAQLLQEIKAQEYPYFPGIEDCVLGLEYQELDLCIDANSKYAEHHTLEELSRALVACNHPSIEFNIFQITDFRQSLCERLKGNLPQIMTNNPQAEEAEDTTTSAAPTEEAQVHQSDPVSELTAAETAAPEANADQTHEVEDTHDEPPVSTEAFAYVAEPSADGSAAALPAGADETEGSEAATEEAVPANRPSDPPAHESTQDQAPSHAIAAQDETKPETRDSHSDQKADELDEPVLQTDAVADVSSSSSTTLESSTHEEEDAEPPFEAAAETRAADDDEAHSSINGVAVGEQDGDGEFYEGDEEEYEADEPPHDQATDLEPSLANIPGSVEPERKEHTSQDVPALESHQTADADDAGESTTTDPMTQHPSASNQLTEEEEYAEYDELYAETVTSTAVDSAPSLADKAVTAEDVKDVNALVPVPRVSRKRSLDDIEAHDTQEYDDDEPFASDSKRARVE